MKKLFTIVSMLVLAVSCNTNKHISGSPVGLVNLENYVAKNNADLPDGFNYMVITNQADFDATFSIAKSGNISITYPGFYGQTVVACIAQPTANAISIHFEKAAIAGKELNVYYSTSNSHEQLKNAIIPAAIATIPKVLLVKRVNFYTNGEKVITKTVDFSNNQANAVKENKTDDTKPVVLKRMMRKPAVI